MNTTDREYSGDLARIIEAVSKIQGKPKMARVFIQRHEWIQAKHTPANLEYKQTVTLDSNGFSFWLPGPGGLWSFFRFEWPHNSKFWEFGTGSATILTFQLARILKRPAGVKDPRNTYVSFSIPGNGKELRILEQDGEFRMVSFSNRNLSEVPARVFKMREFEGMSTAAIQAVFSRIAKTVEV